MEDSRQGGCLCGKVRFEARLHGAHFHACHCGRCRHWGGGPAFATPASSLTLTEDSGLRIYSSSKHGERAFCGHCGTHLFWRLKAGAVYAVWVGSLDENDDLKFESQIFVDRKPESYDFANRTTDLTSEQMRALFTARPG